MQQEDGIPFVERAGLVPSGIIAASKSETCLLWILKGLNGYHNLKAAEFRKLHWDAYLSLEDEAKKAEDEEIKEIFELIRK
jgi:hypothetical protein